MNTIAVILGCATPGTLALVAAEKPENIVNMPTIFETLSDIDPDNDDDEFFLRVLTAHGTAFVVVARDGTGFRLRYGLHFDQDELNDWCYRWWTDVVHLPPDLNLESLE